MHIYRTMLENSVNSFFALSDPRRRNRQPYNLIEEGLGESSP
ncbi:MAG: hypothetical protein AB7T14_06870 [Candidatus Methylacidiphilaceae bacterium]